MMFKIHSSTVTALMATKIPNIGWVLTKCQHCSKLFTCIDYPLHNHIHYYHYLPLTNEEIEVQRSSITSPRLQSWSVVEWGYELSLHLKPTSLDQYILLCHGYYDDKSHHWDAKSCPEYFQINSSNPFTYLPY